MQVVFHASLLRIPFIRARCSSGTCTPGYGSQRPVRRAGWHLISRQPSGAGSGFSALGRQASVKCSSGTCTLSGHVPRAGKPVIGDPYLFAVNPVHPGKKFQWNMHTRIWLLASGAMGALAPHLSPPFRTEVGIITPEIANRQSNVQVEHAHLWPMSHRWTTCR